MSKHPHQHESWQIHDSPDGGKHCAACGEKTVRAPSVAEHTPTDEDALDNYVAGRGEGASGLALPELRAEYGPEFDRWLSAHDARVRAEAEAERDRANAAAVYAHDTSALLLRSEAAEDWARDMQSARDDLSRTVESVRDICDRWDSTGDGIEGGPDGDASRLRSELRDALDDAGDAACMEEAGEPLARIRAEAHEAGVRQGIQDVVDYFFQRAADVIDRRSGAVQMWEGRARAADEYLCRAFPDTLEARTEPDQVSAGSEGKPCGSAGKVER